MNLETTNKTTFGGRKMTSKTQQSKETKQTISECKKLMDNMESEKEKMVLINTVTSGISDSIQRNKISKSLVEHI